MCFWQAFSLGIQQHTLVPVCDRAVSVVWRVAAATFTGMVNPTLHNSCVIDVDAHNLMSMKMMCWSACTSVLQSQKAEIKMPSDLDVLDMTIPEGW